MDIPTRLLSAVRKAPAAAGMAALILGVAACGHVQKSDVPLVPVNGEVTFEGAPLEEAMVRYIPEGSTLGQGGSGLTDDKGFFEISTPFGEPGLTGGDYKVVVSKWVLPPGAVYDPAKGPIEQPGRELVGARYSNPSMTTLRAKVPPTPPPSGKAIHHKFTVKKRLPTDPPGMPGAG